MAGAPMHRQILVSRMMSTLREHEPLSDEQLAAIVAARNDARQDEVAAKRAFNELFRRHSRNLFVILASRIRQSDLDDVHQEIWQRVWQSLPTSFKGGNFRAWLYAIAVNRLIDVSRRKRPEELNAETEFSDPACRPPVELMIETERMASLDRCLQSMDPKFAEVLKARLNGEEYDAICDRLSIPRSQIYKLVQRAKSQLASCIERAVR